MWVGFASDVCLCLSVTSVLQQDYLLNGVGELKKKVGRYLLFLYVSLSRSKKTLIWFLTQRSLFLESGLEGIVLHRQTLLTKRINCTLRLLVSWPVHAEVLLLCLKLIGKEAVWDSKPAWTLCEERSIHPSGIESRFSCHWIHTLVLIFVLRLTGTSKSSFLYPGICKAIVIRPIYCSFRNFVLAV